MYMYRYIYLLYMCSFVTGDSESEGRKSVWVYVNIDQQLTPCRLYIYSVSYIYNILYYLLLIFHYRLGCVQYVCLYKVSMIIIINLHVHILYFVWGRRNSGIAEMAKMVEMLVIMLYLYSLI